MSVFDEILRDAQPNYADEVRKELLFLMETLGETPFAGVDKADFTDRALDLLPAGPDALAMMIKLSELNWWCGLPIGNDARGRMGRLARAAFADVLRNVPSASEADPAARHTHTVFAGQFINPLHSPSRGAIAYAAALVAQPQVETVEVLHTGAMSAELVAHAAEVLGPRAAKVTFEEISDEDDRFLLRAVQGPQRTYHFWCEHPFVMLPTFLALFGPTVSFVCGDSAPVQFSDVYWYAHELEHMAGVWFERGTPPAFITNYQPVEAAPYTPMAPRRARPRHELGFAPDDVVLATVGNRLGIDMDQAYVDGMAAAVLADPARKWLFVGPLQDYWTGALESVLGPQFRHVSFDNDLPSLLAHVDVFANPFRAGGGNTAIMAVEVGAVVLTRGDLGDVRAFVPAHHRAPDAESYFEQLDAIIDDPALRDAWRAEQGALIARRLDQRRFEQELTAMCGLAFERFGARTPVRLGRILAMAEA